MAMVTLLFGCSTFAALPDSTITDLIDARYWNVNYATSVAVSGNVAYLMDAYQGLKYWISRIRPTLKWSDMSDALLSPIRVRLW